MGLELKMEARLSIRNLSVSFGGNPALNSLDLDVLPGTVVALLGANGSGKSTAVKALSGINPIEPGSTIRMNGAAFDINTLTPTESKLFGIRVIHQEAPLISCITVAEAFALENGFPTKMGFIQKKELLRQSEKLLTEFGIKIAVDRLCRTLSPAERSLVSLAMALGDIDVSKALLILDEATASLSTTEAGVFLNQIRILADRGLSVLMVTHRLPEVREYCDEAIVLRDGVRVKSFTKSNFDEREVVHAMVGPDSREILSSQEEVERAEEGHNSIEVNNFQSEGIDGASFSVAHGEILGVTGRPGGGASELLRLLAGIEPLIEGTLEIGNLQTKIRHPRDAINSGIYYISADRLLEGGVAAMTVAENLILPKNERYGLKRTKAAKDVAYVMSMLDIRPSNPFVSFGNLSGGNQQKVLLARWLLLRPRVLLLDDPTVGVDPNTRETIFQTLQTLSSNGTTILLRSSEPEQLARLCERVMIVRDGHIVMELDKNQMTIEEISVAAYA